MVEYILKAEGKEIPLYIVNNQTWGGSQTALVYESAGTNGGVVIVTGRKNNTITLNGRFLARQGETMDNLNDIKSTIQRIKDKGSPVTLIAPIDNYDTDRYVITEFSGNVVEGLATALPFTMTLTEYRQANLQRTAVNLISFEPAEEFKEILRLRQLQQT